MNNFFKNSYKTDTNDLVRTASLEVHNVGFQKCHSEHKWGPGIRNHFLIHHIISGKGTYQIGNILYNLNSGDTFLVYPDIEVAYWADIEQPWEYYWLGLSGSDAERLLDMTDFSEETPVISSNFGTQLKNSLLDIYNASSETKIGCKGNRFRMIGYSYIFLSHLIDASQKTRNLISEGVAYAARAVKYIENNYSHNISVEQVANYVGISRSYLYRLFILNFAISPNNYIINCRIKRACTLLEKGNVSIAKIAVSVGFENQFYFSKAFKRVVGMSPREYLKKI